MCARWYSFIEVRFGLWNHSSSLGHHRNRRDYYHYFDPKRGSIMSPGTWFLKTVLSLVLHSIQVVLIVWYVSKILSRTCPRISFYLATSIHFNQSYGVVPSYPLICADANLIFFWCPWPWWGRQRWGRKWCSGKVFFFLTCYVRHELTSIS